jgi:branched-chain amino acid transport system permease protein
MQAVLRNPYAKAVLASIWMGLLTLPFAGVHRSLFIAGGVCAGSIVVVSLRTLAAKGAFAAVSRLSIRSVELAESFAYGRRMKAALVVLVVALAAFPFMSNRYTLDLAVQAGIYIMLALGLNIVVGQTGLLVLGYVAFYAVGAYTYALLATGMGISFWAALPVAAIFAGIFGLLLGAPVLRLRGDYLAIVTLGFGEITRIVLNNWDSLTGGPNGIANIPRPSAGPVGFEELTNYYYLVLGMLVITVFLVRRLNDSRIGRAWIAIREDEVAAEAMGINTTWLKLLAFGLGAVLAGVAGVFYAAKMRFVSPESFNFLESVIILCMVVLGGMGSIPGVILGAVVLYLMPEGLREFQQYRMLIFGGAMVLMMVFRPQGFIGTKRRKIELAHE